MKKSEVIYGKCKRLAGSNTKALTILLEVFDKGREDILDKIFAAVHTNSNAISPEGIVSLYSRRNGIDGFIEIFDKTMKEAQYIRKSFYNEYEKDINSLNTGK